MACPQGATYSTYWVRVPASGVGYVPRTVAPHRSRRLLGQSRYPGAAGVERGVLREAQFAIVEMGMVMDAMDRLALVEIETAREAMDEMLAASKVREPSL